MSRAFVVDASVAIAWVHPSQAAAHTDDMLSALSEGAAVEAPALWPLEVANALLVLVRRGRLQEAERQAALGWLRGLNVRLDHEVGSLALSTLSQLAAAHELSVYDAAYLELAQRKQLSLACKDGPLRTAATRAGVDLWR